MHGVRGRIDLFGDEAIPLYEDEVREAAAALLDAEVESIVVSLLYSWRNPAHEQRVKELVGEVCDAKGCNGNRPALFLSSELYPLRRDFPRLNSTLVEAYAAEPSREQLQKVRAVTRDSGAAFDLRIMAAHGGTISIEARELARSLVSGPIGGVVGAKHLAEELGLQNVVCTDIGGTSFDIALITGGEYAIKPTPEFGRMILNLPMIQVDSIGAGTGSFVRVNPNSNRPELGPDSAGSKIGVCWPEGGLETPSVSDLNLVLGRLNPDYFLGGDIKLDAERARAAIEEQIAEPLGLSVEQAAAGILELFDETLQYEAAGRVLGKGYSPVDYALFCYGGGGPLHVAGYTSKTSYRDVLVPAWAAGFSAFGCACADLEYRSDLTIDLPIPARAGPDAMAMAVGGIQQAWDALRQQVAAEYVKSGTAANRVNYRCFVRMQYYGQLNDIEVYAPAQQLTGADDVRALIDAFEDEYGKVYARSAKSPELGYLVTHAVVTGSVLVEKPALPNEELSGEEPGAVKGSRDVWWRGRWEPTAIYEQSDLRAGNVIRGPAIVESPADTLAVPPGRRARLDRHRIFHLETEEQ
jgi:acetone carboxylase beta subunit